MKLVRKQVPDQQVGRGRLLQDPVQRRVPHHHPGVLLQGDLRLPRRDDRQAHVHRARRPRLLRRAAALRAARRRAGASTTAIDRRRQPAVRRAL